MKGIGKKAITLLLSAAITAGLMLPVYGIDETEPTEILYEEEVQEQEEPGGVLQEQKDTTDGNLVPNETEEEKVEEEDETEETGGLAKLLGMSRAAERAGEQITVEGLEETYRYGDTIVITVEVAPSAAQTRQTGSGSDVYSEKIRVTAFQSDLYYDQTEDASSGNAKFEIPTIGMEIGDVQIKVEYSNNNGGKIISKDISTKLTTKEINAKIKYTGDGIPQKEYDKTTDVPGDITSKLDIDLDGFVGDDGESVVCNATYSFASADVAEKNSITATVTLIDKVTRQTGGKVENYTVSVEPLKAEIIPATTSIEFTDSQDIELGFGVEIPQTFDVDVSCTNNTLIPEEDKIITYQYKPDGGEYSNTLPVAAGIYSVQATFTSQSGNFAESTTGEKKIIISEGTEYTLTIINTTTTNEQHNAGTIVPLDAGSREGYTFKEWKDDGNWTSRTAVTEYIMPNRNATVTAVWEQNKAPETRPDPDPYEPSKPSEPSEDDDTDDGGNQEDEDSKTPVPQKPKEPSTGKTEIDPVVDGKGEEKADITSKDIDKAIANAEKNADQKGTRAGELTLVLHVNAPSAQSSAAGMPKKIKINLPEVVMKKIIREKIARLVVEVEEPGFSVELDLLAVTAVWKQIQGDAILSVERNDSFYGSAAAQEVLDQRPAFAMEIYAVKDGKKAEDFGSGAVSVKMPYDLREGETPEGLFAVYINRAGKPEYLVFSSYDPEEKVMRFRTSHFSVYSIGYRKPESCGDVGKHPCAEDIRFVTVRGLLLAEKGTFRPDAAVTKGEFLTALAKLAEVKTGASVKDQCAAWAVEKGIVGSGFQLSDWNKRLSRQEMAVMLSAFAKAKGIVLEQNRKVSAFDDVSVLSSGTRTAISALQKAGVLNGMKGNSFSPAAALTRGEACSVLRRFMEQSIDTGSAQGWTRNAAGKWFYYRDGKRLSGPQTVEGVKYTFGPDGVSRKQS